MIHAERFWSKVDKSPGHGPKGECWPWTASLQPEGYGQFRLGDRMVGAHRVAYELEVGPIPEGMDICHTCDFRPCVRPLHLFPGTKADNNHDMIAKGRHRPGRNISKVSRDTAKAIHTAYLVGATQRAIAVSVGLSPTHVGRILRGEVTIQ